MFGIGGAVLTTKIIPFPHRLDLGVMDIEGVIKKWLAAVSTDEELNEQVLKRMIDYITEYTSNYFEPKFDLPIPAFLTEAQTQAIVQSVEKGIDDTAFQVQEMVNKIIVERFFLEIELYQAQKRQKKWPMY